MCAPISQNHCGWIYGSLDQSLLFLIFLSIAINACDGGGHQHPLPLIFRKGNQFKNWCCSISLLFVIVQRKKNVILLFIFLSFVFSFTFCYSNLCCVVFFVECVEFAAANLIERNQQNWKKCVEQIQLPVVHCLKLRQQQRKNEKVHFESKLKF